MTFDSLLLPLASQHAIWLSCKLAGFTTLLLLLLATPIAWWLARGDSFSRHAINALITLPLILPPTVLGFYLLLSFNPEGWIGNSINTLGLGSIAFSFTGLLIGSIIYSLPFAVQPLQFAFESIPPRQLEAAATLGAKPLDVFFSIVLPLSKTGFFTAAILCFAHTLGEFGVVMMIGGNIPGETQVISTQIYGHVEAMEYQQAHLLSVIMLVFSFMALLALNMMNYRKRRAFT